MDVKSAIDTGDAAALRRLLSEDSSRANELIRWGKCLTHPLHYIPDMLFSGTLQKGKELPLVEALIQAGFQTVIRRVPDIGAVFDRTEVLVCHVRHEACSCGA